MHCGCACRKCCQRAGCTSAAAAQQPHGKSLADSNLGSSTAAYRLPDGAYLSGLDTSIIDTYFTRTSASIVASSNIANELGAPLLLDGNVYYSRRASGAAPGVENSIIFPTLAECFHQRLCRKASNYN